MKIKSKAQLNAINRAIAKRNTANALRILEEKYGIDYVYYCKNVKCYKSPVRLLGLLERKCKSVMVQYNEYLRSLNWSFNAHDEESTKWITEYNKMKELANNRTLKEVI